MHRVALVLLVALVPSIAVAQSPPSKTLERAIRLYDVQDFYSATIEAKKVVDGESGDTPENIERARFFLAKSLFQIEFHVPAYVMFAQLVQTGGNYRGASFKWIAGLRKAIPDSVLAPALADITQAELDDPALAQVREELVAIQRAHIPVRHDLHLISRNAMGCTHPDPAGMRALVEKLRGYEDNAELTAATRLALRQGDVYAQTIDLAMQKTPSVRDARPWVGELRGELELLAKSDRAWQTTMIAAEVLQEVTVQHSVAEVDLGARLRQLFDAMSTEIANSASYQTSPALCTRESAPALAGSSKGPMVVQPSAKNGCGCASGGSPDGGLLAGLLLAVALRRKSRAASRTRSPRT